MSELNNFKADVTSANYVIEKFHENPGKFASVVLRMYWDMENQCKQYKANNDRLIRLNQKLEAYVRMWDKVKDWKKKELEKDSNNDLLHDLSDNMNRLERDMYKERG